MEQLIYFHDHSIFVMSLVLLMVLSIIVECSLSGFPSNNMTRNHLLEFIWTIFPGVLLVFIAIPSLFVLYISEDSSDHIVTLKCIGHQWFWTYEYRDLSYKEFDSYIKQGDLRILEVDSHTMVPLGINIRVLTSSGDVIHSWAVPGLGVKIDARPGRINQVNLYCHYLGVFYGQCSEICGILHSYMPIVIECSTLKNFFKWLEK